MEIPFSPEVEAKLEELSRQTGDPTAKLVEEAVTAHLNELAQIREMLDSRYDDLESGRVKPIPGDEVIARLRAKSDARRSNPA
jgi:predicted transcriptional regulator